jgi:acetoacetate decarboxylase
VGVSEKLASPKIATETDVLVGTLHYGSALCVSATMGYKHRAADHDAVMRSRKAPNFMLKSSRMSTAPRASASWCAIISKTSC